ncbi:MAG: CBS and ACT domain-containing protein [Kouleothrix sp.]
MLVGERMTHPVIPVHPDTPVPEALTMMRREHIRRMPVVQNGKLIGIVTDRDLLHASASSATTLSIWELNYLLSKLTVEKVMSIDVLTVTEATPIEEAARTMADNKIGGLPVLRDGHVVGMITETDLFRVLLEMTGAREMGVRATVLIPDTAGQLARLTHAVAEIGGNIVALGTFAGEDTSNSTVMCKVIGVEPERLRAQIAPLVERVIDLRVC